MKRRRRKPKFFFFWNAQPLEETVEAVTLVPRERVLQETAEQIGDGPQLLEETVPDDEERPPAIAQNSATTAFRHAHLSSVLCDLCNDCTCEHVACGRCICLQVQQSKSLLGMVELGLPSLRRTVPRQPFRLSSQQSQSLLGMVKLGLPSLRSTVPRQNPKSQCPLVELGRHGPEQRAPSAGVTAAARPAGEARHPGIGKQGARTDSDIAVSSSEARPSWPHGIAKQSATTEISGESGFFRSRAIGNSATASAADKSAGEC